MKRSLWSKLIKKTDTEQPIEPPIWFGNRSNGEYFHEPTPQERRMRKEILRRADEQARHLGMDRREFLASSMGMALTMGVINQLGACSSSDDPVGTTTPMGGDAGGSGGMSGATEDGPYVIPVDATCDPSNFLDHDYFIFDIQTHSFDDGEWREKNIVYPFFLSLTTSCMERSNPLDCYDRDRYGRLMFVESTTTMSVISSWPAATCFPERELLTYGSVACGLPLSNEAMRDLRNWLNERAMSQRVVNQVQVMPNDILERQIDGMRAAAEDPQWRAVAWKAYPAWRSDTYVSPEGYAEGYFLTDPIGIAFIEAGLELGIPNFAIHKGLPIPGFDVEHNKPTDIGPVARDYPSANFIIYHSAINAGTGGSSIDAVAPMQTELVPYSSDDPNPLGVNMLIRSLIENGLIRDPDLSDSVDLPARLNVFAETGSAWSQVMRDPIASQHYIGKLLKYLGEDNIMWGTDSILGGSPQAEIDLFLAFSITPEYQELHGYPELTDQAKRKILGLNAARIHRIDAEATRCRLNADQFALYRQKLDEEIGPRRWTQHGPIGPRTRREFFRLAKYNRAKGLPG